MRYKYIESNDTIIESKLITTDNLLDTQRDVTLASKVNNSTNARTRLIIRNKIQKNEFGNMRVYSYFIVFEDLIIRGTAGYLEDAIEIYNKL